MTTGTFRESYERKGHQYGAYDLTTYSEDGVELTSPDDIEGAMESYSAALDLAPDEATNGEAAFWVGVTLADLGRTEEALPFLRRAYRQDARWAELLTRLPASGLLPGDAALIDRLVEAMEE